MKCKEMHVRRIVATQELKDDDNFPIVRDRAALQMFNVVPPKRATDLMRSEYVWTTCSRALSSFFYSTPTDPRLTIELTVTFP